MFDREGFKAYVGINSGNSYASGLESIEKEYGVDIIDMADVKDADALVLCVAHKEFVALSAEEINALYSSEGKNVFFDVKSAFSKEQFKDYNFSYWSL